MRDVCHSLEGILGQNTNFCHCALTFVEFQRVSLDMHVWHVGPGKIKAPIHTTVL